MKQKTRDGVVMEQPNGQDRVLSVLYGKAWGRAIIKPFTARWPSQFMGWFLSTRASCVFIKRFVRKNNIDMTQFADVKYRSYNAFFTRQIKDGARVIDTEPAHLISPCDSKLTVIPVTADGRFSIKHTEYTVESLLKNAQEAAAYEGGTVLIFRLTVDDYHRYCYVADGEKGEAVKIPGRLHTVNPIANDYFPIYKENTREYCPLETEAFGRILMMEVGALMVGKIVNHPVDAPVCRGQEKGYFCFGGSTVVVLLKKGVALLDDDILENSREGYETVVKYGEKIGISQIAS